MRRGHKQLRDEILVTRRHARAALAAAPLRPVGGQRHAFDVAFVRNGDDAILALDQIFVLDLAFHFDDFGFARRRELGLDGHQL